MALYHYLDTVQDVAGNAVSNASVTIKLAGTNTLASLFSDAAGTTPVSNPVSTDNVGIVSVYVAAGNYDITVSGSRLVTNTQSNQSLGLFLPSVGTAGQALVQTDVATSWQDKVYKNPLDYAGGDICAQINAAIQAGAAHGVGVMVQPKSGGYTCSGAATIIIDRPTHLMCAGGRGTNDATHSSCAITFPSGVNGMWIKPTSFGGTRVENFNLISGGGTATAIIVQGNSTYIGNNTLYEWAQDGVEITSDDLGAGGGNADGSIIENNQVWADVSMRHCFYAHGIDANTVTYISNKCTKGITNAAGFCLALYTPANLVLSHTCHTQDLVDYHIESLGNRIYTPYSEGTKKITVNGADTYLDLNVFGGPVVDTASTNAVFSRITAPYNIENGNRHWCDVNANCSAIDLQLITDGTSWLWRDPIHASALYFTFTPGATTDIRIGGTASIAGQFVCNDNLILNGANKSITVQSGSVTVSSQLASQVVTGTPPLVVASTTEVTNLNAQMWHGKQALEFSGTLNFPSIAAQTCSELTLAVTNAAVNDAVAPSWPSALETGLAGSMRVSGAGIVTVRLCNVTVGAIDPASQTYGGTVRH